MLQRLKLLRHLGALGAVAKGLFTPENWEKNVVMLHEGRCGSSVLAGLLGQHSSIHWDGEVFGKSNPGGPVIRYIRYSYPLLYLRQRIARSEHSIYGFETKTDLHLQRYIGVSRGEYLDGLKGLGVSRYIVLDRKNNLRRRVSVRVAKKTKKWLLSKREEPQLVRVELDPESVLFWLRRLEKVNDELDELLSDETVLRLTYEEHIKPDPRIGYRRACEFLGLSPEEVSVGMRRINPYPLSDMIKNYDEVCRSLSGTKFEWMLEG